MESVTDLLRYVDRYVTPKMPCFNRNVAVEWFNMNPDVKRTDDWSRHFAKSCHDFLVLINRLESVRSIQRSFAKSPKSGANRTAFVTFDDKDKLFPAWDVFFKKSISEMIQIIKSASVSRSFCWYMRTGGNRYTDRFRPLWNIRRKSTGIFFGKQKKKQKENNYVQKVLGNSSFANYGQRVSGYGKMVDAKKNKGHNVMSDEKVKSSYYNNERSGRNYDLF